MSNSANRKAFDTWRESNPEATKESAQKVWRLYSGEEDAEKREASFKELDFKTTRVNTDVNPQLEGGAPKKDAAPVTSTAK